MTPELQPAALAARIEELANMFGSDIADLHWQVSNLAAQLSPEPNEPAPATPGTPLYASNQEIADATSAWVNEPESLRALAVETFGEANVTNMKAVRAKQARKPELKEAPDTPVMGAEPTIAPSQAGN